MSAVISLTDIILVRDDDDGDDGLAAADDDDDDDDGWMSDCKEKSISLCMSVAISSIRATLVFSSARSSSWWKDDSEVDDDDDDDDDDDERTAIIAVNALFFSYKMRRLEMSMERRCDISNT